MTTAVKPRKPERRNEIKTALRPFEIKSVDTTGRTFEGLAAAYSLDLGGDVIIPGAFGKTLSYWKDKGFAIPLINQHQYYNGIHDVLGSMIDAEERPEGLWAKFEVDDGADGQKLLRHIQNKRLNGLSIGYQPVDYEINNETGVRTLKELKLKEVSAVIWPMNEDAVIDSNSVKSLTSPEMLEALSDDEIKESLDALQAEAKAREEKANPPIPQEEADSLRDSILSLELRLLHSRTSGQKSAHSDPNYGNPNERAESKAPSPSH